MEINWPVKKLGEVAEIIVGKTPGIIDYLNSGEYKVLKYRDITKNGIDWDKYDKGFVKQNSLKGLKEVQLGDLLITSAGHSSEKIGEEAVVIEKLPSQFKKVFFASELICYRAIPKIILPEWLLLYILSEFGQSQLKKIIGDSVHLTKEKSQEIEIPVPAIEEQRKIVKKLEKILAKIDGARTLRQETIIDTKIVLKSALNKIFSNKKLETKKIGEIVNAETKRYSDGGLPYLGMEDIESDTGELLGEPETESVKSTTFYFNNAHVLYGKLRPYLNKVFLPTFEGHCTTEFIPLKPDPRILKREFLALWLRSPKTLSQLSGRTTGTRMPRADMHLLMSLEIPIPDLNEQEEIVAHLDGLSEKIQKLQKLQQEQLQELECLKQSVLHQAFQGELEVWGKV